jgi:hypothetical protein
MAHPFRQIMEKKHDFIHILDGGNLNLRWSFREDENNNGEARP